MRRVTTNGSITPRENLEARGSAVRFTGETQDSPLEQAAAHVGDALHPSVLQNGCGNRGARPKSEFTARELAPRN
jgi:hypothetical protein